MILTRCVPVFYPQRRVHQNSHFSVMTVHVFLLVGDVMALSTAPAAIRLVNLCYSSDMNMGYSGVIP